MIVRSHNRKVKHHRGVYHVVQRRQLPRRSSNVLLDAEIKALKPGKRRSRNGRVYYERRYNRSDTNEYL